MRLQRVFCQWIVLTELERHSHHGLGGTIPLTGRAGFAPPLPIPRHLLTTEFTREQAQEASSRTTFGNWERWLSRRALAVLVEDLG